MLKSCICQVVSFVKCQVSNVKCLSWSLGHAEQLLFSCLGWKLSVSGWKCQCFFLDTSSITLPCEFANHRAGSQLKKIRITLRYMYCKMFLPDRSTFPISWWYCWANIECSTWSGCCVVLPPPRHLVTNWPNSVPRDFLKRNTDFSASLGALPRNETIK